METKNPVTPTPPRQPAPRQTLAPTSAERDRLINAVSATMQPALRKEKPVDPVNAWLPQVRKKRRQGYSLRQIAAMLASPSIGIKTSGRTLQRLLNAGSATQKPATPATPPAKA